MGPEPNILVQRKRFDVVVVDPDPAVRVSDRNVEGEVVVERVVGVTELGESGIGDVELEDVGAYDEPEEECEYQSDDYDCGQDFAYEAYDAVEDATAAAGEATAAAARTVVGFPVRRRNWWAVVCAV